MVMGTAPSRKAETTRHSISSRLNQTRALLPSSMHTVRTGTVDFTPTTQAMAGIMMTPVPKPATPPIVDPTMAARARVTHPVGSGIEPSSGASPRDQNSMNSHPKVGLTPAIA